MSAERLALDGGAPIRREMLPYGRHTIDEADVAAVVETLRSGWLTTGPKVAEFERRFAARVGAPHAVALSNGTAALHAMLHAVDIGPGDEVIVPPLSFVATANSVLYRGATPVFADVDPATLLLDPAAVEALLTPRTRAVLAMDYAGQPCDYPALRTLTEPRGIRLLADACHSLGAALGGEPVGTLADLSAFSFHPVKGIATAEGGMVTTRDPALAARLRTFRNHGIDVDLHQRAELGTWSYAAVDLGYNYRLSDLHCALGIAQLQKLDGFIARRQEIAARYDEAFADLAQVAPLARGPAGSTHAYHLYVIRLRGVDRKAAFAALRAEGIGVNVHYPPIHQHPYYRGRFGDRDGLCPVAESAYAEILSLPVFPGMTDEDQQDVVAAVRKVCRALGEAPGLLTDARADGA